MQQRQDPHTYLLQHTGRATARKLVRPEAQSKSLHSGPVLGEKLWGDVWGHTNSVCCKRKACPCFPRKVTLKPLYVVQKEIQILPEKANGRLTFLLSWVFWQLLGHTSMLSFQTPFLRICNQQAATQRCEETEANSPSQCIFWGCSRCWSRFWRTWAKAGLFWKKNLKSG